MKKRYGCALLVAAGMVVAIPAAIDFGDSMSNASTTFSSTFGLETLDWEGHTWSIRGTNDGVVTWGGPQATHPETGESYWVAGANLNDQGDLVLQSQGIDGGVELTSDQAMGYGTYTLRYSGDFEAYDPNTVLGIFTYDWADRVLPDYSVQGGFTEIDFNEISRWGEADRPQIQGGATMYADADGHRFTLDEFDVPSGTVELITTATWQPGRLHIVTTLADGTVLSDATATEHVPASDAQQLHLNLWTTSAGEGFADASGDTVVFHEFSYDPASKFVSCLQATIRDARC